jgi:hypothetical protein
MLPRPTQLFLAIVLMARTAPAAEAPPRVLSPDAREALTAAVRAAGLSLHGLGIGTDMAEVKACRASGTCFRFRASDPVAGCVGGRAAGDWCLAVQEGESDPIALDALAAALAGPGRQSPWMVPSEPAQPFPCAQGPGCAGGKGGEDANGRPGGREVARGEVKPYLLAVAMVAGPLVAGWLLGAALRGVMRRRVRSRLATAALLLGPPAAACLLPRLPMGFWDLLEASVLVGVALVLAGTEWGCHAGTRLALRGAVLAALTVALLEVGTRLLLPAPPEAPSISFAQPLLASREFPALDMPDAWAVLYPDAFPSPLTPREEALWTRWERAEAKVLHVGDSMVTCTHGDLYSSVYPFPDAALPGVMHLSRGQRGTGPDFYRVAARVWAARAHPDLVIAYLFGENDLSDMDRPYACCDDGPLLDYGSSPPTWLCPKPRWGPSHNAVSLAGPLPYPWRVATAFSEVARHVLALHLAAVVPPPEADATKHAHLEAALRAMRDDAASTGSRLVFVVLPVRSHLAAESGSADTDTERLLAAARALDVTVLDARAPFEEAARREGAAPFFNEGSDPHFSAWGHRLLWDWVGRRLQGLGMLPPAGPRI